MISCDTPNLGSALIYLRNQYTQQWNFTVQRQIASRMAFTTGYVGNRTVRLQSSPNENDPAPGPGAVQPRRTWRQWRPMTLAQWGGKANYNGFQNQLELRDWRGLTLMGSYVFSKCMDTGTDEGIPAATGLIGKTHALCDFDSTHVGTISFNYALPVGKGKQFVGGASGPMNAVVGGWQLASVVTMKSGLPFSPTIGQDVANVGETGQWPNRVGTPTMVDNVNCWFYVASNSSCKALAPNATSAYVVPAQYTFGNGGRNTLRAQPLAQLDLSLEKSFAVTESKKLQIRGEIFNLFNHPVFAAPGTNIDQTSGGQVSATLNSDRIIEFAMKVYF